MYIRVDLSLWYLLPPFFPFYYCCAGPGFYIGIYRFIRSVVCPLADIANDSRRKKKGLGTDYRSWNRTIFLPVFFFLSRRRSTRIPPPLCNSFWHWLLLKNRDFYMESHLIISKVLKMIRYFFFVKGSTTCRCFRKKHLRWCDFLHCPILSGQNKKGVKRRAVWGPAAENHWHDTTLWGRVVQIVIIQSGKCNAIYKYRSL